MQVYHPRYGPILPTGSLHSLMQILPEKQRPAHRGGNRNGIIGFGLIFSSSAGFMSCG
jgi:hypothetical protein